MLCARIESQGLCPRACGPQAAIDVAAIGNPGGVDMVRVVRTVKGDKALVRAGPAREGGSDTQPGCRRLPVEAPTGTGKTEGARPA